jgi:thiamine-phosphate pyrophosphorylase
MSDPGLIRWAYAAAARRRDPGPVLWLFTDTRRLPDPLPAASRLPRGLAGVVLRHDDHPNRVAIGHALARICRQRRLALVVAGDSRLAAALHAGVHLRGGFWPDCRRPIRRRAIPLRHPRAMLVTSSAHNFNEVCRAGRNGADVAFLSPAFPTASHPGAPAIGAVRWSGLARRAPLAVAALGGIDGATIGRLRFCRSAAAIGALAVE